MSLYLGNLSARSRKDDLECVFRRFGRCNVRLKDGFGFVVYDFPVNAENALKTLQGCRRICGEALTLTWSNKQPKSFKKNSRATGTRKLHFGRHYSRRDNSSNRPMGPNSQRDYKMIIKPPDLNVRRRVASSDRLDEETVAPEDIVKDQAMEDHDYKAALPNENSGIEPNAVDNDRWDGKVRDNSTDDGIDNGTEFDQYEPYQGYEREDENIQKAKFRDSPVLRSPQERVGTDQIGDVTLNCLSDSKSKQAYYNCGGTGHKMHDYHRASASLGKTTRFYNKKDNDIERVRGKGELERFGSRSRRKSWSRTDTIPLKRRRGVKKASDSRRDERLRRSGSSHTTRKSDKACRKRFTTKNCRTLCGEVRSPKEYGEKYSERSALLPFHSRSSSTSLYSRSKSSKFRSRSTSPSSLSLSGSLGQPLPSSNKMKLNIKDKLDNSPTQDCTSVKQAKQIEVDGGSDDTKLEKMMVSENVEFFKMENGMEKSLSKESDANESLLISRSSHDVANPGTPLSEKGMLPTGSLSPESLRETMELDGPNMLAGEHMPMPMPVKKPDSEAHINSYTTNSLSLSNEELHMVLKHYGLALPEEKEMQLSVDSYFGSACLWPWEMIYYRRLKKGLISTQNYARRLAQNKEFGIVDKYVRSSSGWGELCAKEMWTTPHTQRSSGISRW